LLAILDPLCARNAQRIIEHLCGFLKPNTVFAGVIPICVRNRKNVDTLFEVKHFSVFFALFGSCGDGVKTGVIERLIVL
jgi:hypothetical protein